MYTTLIQSPFFSCDDREYQLKLYISMYQTYPEEFKALNISEHSSYRVSKLSNMVQTNSKFILLIFFLQSHLKLTFVKAGPCGSEVGPNGSEMDPWRIWGGSWGSDIDPEGLK